MALLCPLDFETRSLLLRLEEARAGKAGAVPPLGSAPASHHPPGRAAAPGSAPNRWHPRSLRRGLAEREAGAGGAVLGNWKPALLGVTR